MIGLVGSMKPIGVKPSQDAKCPSWKMNTTAPNAAPSETTFITIAFSGRMTEPKARNSRTKVTRITKPAIHGSFAPRPESWSTRSAV